MAVFKWSQTAAANGSADSSCPFPEGMAPSAVNDGVRGLMAAVAQYRDDTTGAIVTSGTNAAYTVSTFSGFDTLAHMAGEVVAFSPHATNAATVTLNVDSLGAKPLRTSPGVELQAGTIIQGTPYVAIYNNTDGAFYLQGFYGNPYNVPLGGGMLYFGTTAPNSSFALPFGQAISRATYANLFNNVTSTFYGVGDGSTTFNLPDLRGRVPAGADNMGGTAANRLTSASGMGSGLISQVGGAETHILLSTEMPAHSHGVTDPQHSHAVSGGVFGGSDPAGGSTPSAGGSQVFPKNNVAIALAAASTGISIQNTGGGAAHAIVQPTLVCSYIMRVI